MIDLKGGAIKVSRGKQVIELSKAEVLLSRDSKDITDLLTTKFNRSLDQIYYFHRDPIMNEWECISGPAKTPQPSSDDWPSAQRTVKS